MASITGNGTVVVLYVTGVTGTAVDNAVSVSQTQAPTSFQVGNAIVQVAASLVPGGVAGVAGNAIALSFTGINITENQYTTSRGDVLNILGSSAGIAAAILGLAGLPVAAGALTVVAVGFAVAGAVNTLYGLPPNTLSTAPPTEGIFAPLPPELWTIPGGVGTPAISPTVNTTFTAAQNIIPRRDPLVLDLDGDGIELIAVNGSVLFDHNADGIKTGTGWAAANDGLLVRDLNGNGLIDSGRELFGIDTIKSDNTFATQGFDALKELDSNLDGFITADDTAFSQLKVWQDLNQDGISQTTELKTLSQWGITSIGVNGTTTGPQAGQIISGNQVALSTTFTQNGAARTVGAIDFQVNNFFSQFPAQVVDEAGNPVAITEQAKVLPQMNGSGMVRNMHAAASLSSDFATALTSFASATTRDAQRSQLDDLIDKWGDTSGFVNSLERLAQLGTVAYTMPPGVTQAHFVHMIDVLEAFNGALFYRLDGPAPAGFGRTASTGFLINPPAEQVALLQQAYDDLKESVYGALVVQTRLKPYLDDIQLNVSSTSIQFDFSALDQRLTNRHDANPVVAVGDLMDMRRLMGNALEGGGWDGLALLTNWLVTDANIPAFITTLKDFGISGVNFTGTGNNSNEILVGSSGGAVLDGGGGNDMLLGGAGSDTLRGGIGADTLHGGAGADTYVFNLGDGRDTVLETRGNQTTGQIQGLTADTLQLNGMLAGELLIAQDSDNLTLTHINGRDQVTVAHWFAQDGEQHQLDTLTLNGGVSYDLHTLQLGGVADDTLTGTASNDILVGGAGNDMLTAAQGNDWLDGGIGADQMTGGLGDDVYVVDNVLDTVIESANEGTDIVHSSVTYTLSANVENLVLMGAAAINGTGNALNNVLTGNSAANTLAGGLGDDVYMVDNNSDAVIENVGEGVDIVRSSVSWTLSANVENLVLTGNAAINGIGNALGNVVTGNSADNTLDGGAGVDTLNGGLGSDTYKFGFGSGHDAVIDSGGLDSIQMASGVLASDVTLSRNPRDPNSSLILTLTGGADTLTLHSWYLGAANQVEQIFFSDGTVWKLTQAVGLGNNTLNGTAGNDVLMGLGGDDTLIGSNGSDIYDGGAGNDTYQAGASTTALAGNSTYKFGFGSGQDVVMEATGWSPYSPSYGGGIDTIQMAAGVLASDVSLRNDGNGNLILTLTGGADTLTVNGWYQSTAQQVEQISFADGTVWNLTQLAPALSITGTAGGDTVNELDNVLVGDASANVLNGGLGADRMTGGLGNDTYVIDNAGDAVIEYLAEGSDTVQSFITYSLGANIENLTLVGTSTVNGTGNELDNKLTGNAADNLLTGGAGNDVLIGGLGNDTYVLDNTGDVVTELANEGTDTVVTSVSLNRELGANQENVSLSGSAAISAWGNALDNVLTGNAGDNTLYGLAGNDTMIGGAGNDTYDVWEAGDVVVENADEGWDIIWAYRSYVLGANQEVVVLNTSTAMDATGNELNNYLYAGAGDNVLDGKGGWDTVAYDRFGVGVTVSLGITGAQATGGSGSDTLINIENLYGSNSNDTLSGNGGDNVLNGALGVDTLSYANAVSGVSVSLALTTAQITGGAGTDTVSNFEHLTGSAFNDTLSGDAGANTLIGGAGNDTMAGGLGNDTYEVKEVGDVVIENTSEGTDAVWAYINYTLGANVENLILSGAVGNMIGTGNALNNTIIGSNGNDTLDGGAGADSLSGGAGDDQYIVDNAGDVVTELANGGASDAVYSTVSYSLGANVEHLVLQGAGAINATGNALNNHLYSNAGNNVLDGGAGQDLAAYSNASAGVSVSLAITGAQNTLGAGSDTLLNIEDLYGSAFNDTLTGDAGANILDGGSAGADSLIGGAGNDIYVVDNAGDVVTELANEGTDLIYSRVSYTLGANLEQLSLQGTAAINASGNAQDNALYGQDNSAANILSGGLGNDVYYVGAGDSVVEAAGAGTDTVVTFVDYTLGANLENLLGYVVTGLRLTGNELNNTITGNSGNDTIDGGAGADSLDGGAGADTLSYASATAGVSVSLALTTAQITGGAGSDTVSNFEHLSGSAFNDTLTGNAGANTLVGGAGADSLKGGLGNDTYEVKEAGDVVVENAAEGTDTVWAYVNYTLSANVENLVFSNAVGNMTGTGNTLNNLMIGSNGNDTLTGGVGADTLTGGAGADTFVLTALADSGVAAGLRDVITDFVSGTDKIQFMAIDANTNVAGDQAFTMINTSAFSNVAGQLRYFVQNSNTILEGDVNGDGVADCQVQLTGAKTFVAADLLL
jgi:trimeric autotransporter adhesin